LCPCEPVDLADRDGFAGSDHVDVAFLDVPLEAAESERAVAASK